MPGLRLWLFGPSHFELDDQPVELQRRKVLALLVYLAVTDEAHSRDSLATLLWPEANQSTARTALRRDLSALNKVLGHAWLEIDHESVRFKRGAASPAAPEATFWLDLDEFHRLLSACETHGHLATDACSACLPLLEEAVGLYRGEFLAGFTLRDSPEFDEWQFFQAESLRAEMASALERLVRGHSARGEEGAAYAIPYARRWLALDAMHESAHRALMRLYAVTGQHSAALRQYAECSRTLEQELGVPPSAQTTQLYEAIKAGRLRPPQASLEEQPHAILAHPPSAAQVAPTHPASTLGVGGQQTEPTERPLFVAHEQELMQLDRYLDRALAGNVQAVFVVGEAGSGKTALVQEFARRAQARDAGLIVAGGNCNAYTGLGDPYLPFREILGMLSGDTEAAWAAGPIGGPGGQQRLQALVPYTIQALVRAGPDLVDTFIPGPALVARAGLATAGGSPWQAQLEQLVARHAAAGGPAGPKQSDLFEQYTRVIQELASIQPLVLVLDDLQWADTGSINLLFHMGRRLRRSRVLIVGLYRPSELALGRPAISQRAGEAAGVIEMERHPLESLVHEFQQQFGELPVDLSLAQGRHFVDALLDVEPNGLGSGFRERLYEHTGGHALFTVAMLTGLQQRGDLIRDEHGRWVEGPALNWEILPARVEGVIGEQIGRLQPASRELLKTASIEGEVFTAEVVARVQRKDEQLVVRLLGGELDRQHHLVWNQGSRRLSAEGQRLSHYRFRHILFQKYLYQSMDPAERAYLHESVGNEMERLFDGQTAEIAVELARHFEQAALPARAVGYYQQAGDRAVRLSANQEALAHLYRGLALLENLPKTPERDRQELALQIALFAPLAGAKGYAAPELGKAYARARELCEEGCEADQLFLVLYGLWGHNLVRGELRIARDLGEQSLALAETTGKAAFLMEAHRMMDEVSFHRGEFVAARQHLKQALALYDPKQHRAHAYVYGQDPGVAALSHGSWILWHLGYPDQALRMSRDAVTLGKDSAHPFSLAYALSYAAVLHQFCGEVEAVEELAEAAIALSREQGFVLWMGLAMALRGWARAEQGQREEGIEGMRWGLDEYRALSQYITRPHLLTLLAEAYGRAGQAMEGLSLLAEALAVAERGEVRDYEAELYRLQGDLLLSQGETTAEVETHYRRALETARLQEARSLELRATVSLCRLWQEQGKTTEARALLAETYGWFTEGFATADLQDARALLEALS
jgi:DNA-binding SARP family transcriptional activator/predicted ATPase